MLEQRISNCKFPITVLEQQLLTTFSLIVLKANLTATSTKNLILLISHIILLQISTSMPSRGNLKLHFQIFQHHEAQHKRLLSIVKYS